MSNDWSLDEAEEKGAELAQDAFGPDAAPPIAPELTAAPSTDWPDAPRLADFFARTEGEIDWIWDKMMMRGSVNILGAYMKVGKSSLVMNIVRGLVEQHHLFDFTMNLGEGRIFWFAPEDSERIIRYNLNHAGITPDRYGDKLVLITKGDPYLEKLRSAKQGIRRRWELLKDALRRDKAELVIFDTMNTFSHYLGLEDENDNQAVTKLMDLVAELKEMGITVLITQHTGKNQERGGTLQSIRGASAYAALADQILLLTQPGGEQARTTRRVLTIIGRTSIDSPAFLNLDYDKSTASYMRLPDDAKMVDEDPIQAQVSSLAAWLRKQRPGQAFTQRQVREAKLGIGNSKLAEIFNKLKSGEVDQLACVDGKVTLPPDPDDGEQVDLDYGQ